MREIDLENWPRRAHFYKFRDWHDPYFNICGNVDLTRFFPAVRQRGVSLTAAIVYLIARTANDIPEFRWRIRGETVVEHEIVHPTLTVLVDEGLFSFCYFDYCQDFPAFARHFVDQVAAVKEDPTLAELEGRDDLMFMTAIPWVSFTSFSHPIPAVPADSVPRIAWGKVFEDGDRVMMPFSVQGHHALMDGFHVGRYFERFEAYASDPDSYLEGG
jgi:chloramphenicol O-acetyltransferase type A